MTSKLYHVQWDIHEPCPDREVKSVVAVGRLTEFSSYKLQCTLSCTRSSCKEPHALIDISLIDTTTCPVIGSLVKVFGDLTGDSQSTIITAKIITCADSLNTTLYHKALQMRKNYKSNIIGLG